MGRNSRKDNRPNPVKYVRSMYPGIEQEIETPQGKHKFVMMPSYALYWVTPEGPWRRVTGDASK